MKVNKHITYDFLESYERLEEIIDSTSNFEEYDDVPNSESLTYTNGYYFDCYSIFIDIRDSSKLPERYQRRTLAKIYRAYISEVVAIFQSYENCKEINIVGDSVWAIFRAKNKADILEVFSASYTAQSLIGSLNYKLCKKGIESIRVGTGIGKGRALMIKAGFKGSSINNVIYMGHVVNQASKMCSKAGKEVTSSIVIDSECHNDLSGYQNSDGKKYQEMFEKKYLEDYYHGSLIRMDMEEWLNEKKRNSPC